MPAIYPAIRPAIGPAIVSLFDAISVLPFADAVASWFDTGAPGRFVPTYRDWQTSGALFQDRDGTQPVTALEQFVGLNLDRSRGLKRGDELVTVPNVNGVAIGGPSTTAYGVGAPIVIGRTYEVTYTVSGYTGSNTVGFGSSTFSATGSAVSANGTYTFRAQAISTRGAALFTRDVNTANFTGISIKEIYGNHRIQATSQSRPILTARKNWLANSAWLGGGAVPTGWSAGGGSGTTAPNGTIDGNVIYRQTAAAQRPFTAPSANISLAVGQTITFGFDVGTIYSGSFTVQNILFFTDVTAAGTRQYYVNGVPANFTDIVPPNSRVELAYTCTTAGTGQMRFGLGANAAVTGDADFSRPSQTLGGITQTGRYQRTGLSPQTGDYDAVGFPVGLRYDGIDDCMYTAAPIDYSATDKVTAVYATRKESATTGFLFEHGPSTATTPGTLNMYNSAGDLRFEARGDAASATALIASTPTPWAGVASCAYDLAGASRLTELFPRIDGVVPTLTPGGGADAGGGKLTAQVDYEGARANASNRYTGLILGELKWGDVTALASERRAYIEREFSNLSLEA